MRPPSPLDDALVMWSRMLWLIQSEKKAGKFLIKMNTSNGQEGRHLTTEFIATECLYSPGPLDDDTWRLPSHLLYVTDKWCRDEELRGLTQLRLDRKKLTSISTQLLNSKGQPALPNITNVYIQYNEISSLEGLDNFPRLKFLAAFHNNIREVKI